MRVCVCIYIYMYMYVCGSRILRFRAYRVQGLELRNWGLACSAQGLGSLREAEHVQSF